MDDMMEILQVAGIIGIIVFSLMRVGATDRDKFFGYNLLYGTSVFGICVAFFEAPVNEALIAALGATVIAHLLSLPRSSRSSASNTQNQSAGTKSNSAKKPAAKKPAASQNPGSNAAAQKRPTENKKPANQPKPQTQTPQKPKTEPQTPPKTKTPPQTPPKTKTPPQTPPKPKAEPQVQKAPQKQPAEKKEIKQTLHSCLRCGKRITSAVCGYCQYNNATGGIRMLCRVDPRKLQLRKPNSEQ